jgi:hypothetical protein
MADEFLQGSGLAAPTVRRGPRAVAVSESRSWVTVTDDHLVPLAPGAPFSTPYHRLLVARPPRSSGASPGIASFAGA